MTDNDHLSTEVSVEGRITETGLSARAKSRAIAAIDRLIGATADVAASKMETWATRIRNQSRLESTVYDAAVERLGDTIGERENAARLVDELLASQIHAIANKKHVTERAVEHLASSTPNEEIEPEYDTEQVDPDWLNYFGGYAEKATSENVRDLWARVLAGEIRRPASFSLATLRLLAELDQQMASWFEQETAFRIGGEYILQTEEQSGDQVTRLTFLEEVGLLQHVSPIGGMARTFNPDQNGYAVIVDGNLCLRIQMDGPAQLSVIPITRVGQEICRILPPADSDAVLRQVAEALRSKVTSMDICRVIARDRRGVRISSPIEVLKSGSSDLNQPT